MLSGLSFLIFTLFSCSVDHEEKQSAGDQERTITILQTADIHGQLFEHDELFWEHDSIIFKRLGGLARVKTIFEEERHKNPEGTIILDGGDLIQGSAIAALSKGDAFGPIVKAMGYDFLIPGNWEVVYGKQQMIDVLKSYETPVIAANMYDEYTGENIFPPYFIKNIQGLKMGFIAYNDPEVPIRQNPSFSEGMRFDPIVTNLKQLITELKDKQKVDYLFLVTHIGISKQFDLANDPILNKVDYILGNDTHERIRKPLQGKYAKVTEPGAFGSFVGKLTLTVKNGKVIKEDYALIEVDPEIYKPDSKLSQIIEKELHPYAGPLNTVLGYSTTPLYRYFVVENPMDNFITDAARWKTGADISISNGFRFSPPLATTIDGKIPITESDLWSMLPVNEKVKISKVTGKQLRNWLEKELNNVFAQKSEERFGGWLVRFSGMEIAFYANHEKGKRIASIKVNGEDLDPFKSYTVSACRREGEPDNMLCRIPNTTDPHIMDYTIHDAVKEYLKYKRTVSPVRDGRAKALDLGDNVLSQLPGTDYHFH